MTAHANDDEKYNYDRAAEQDAAGDNRRTLTTTAIRTRDVDAALEAVIGSVRYDQRRTSA